MGFVCIEQAMHAILMFRRLVSILLLASFSLLTGCSAVRVVYNQADTVLAWMAHDYFDLDPAQKHEFNKRIDTLLAWHRQEQLPDYARFLGEMKQRAQRNITRDDALWLIEGTKSRFRVIAEKGTPDAVDLLATLTSDNIHALEKEFAKVNQKFTREYKLGGTQEDRRRARLDRTLKRIRDWTGPLSHAQEERIAVLNNNIPYTDHLRQQERQRRQKEFLALLATRNNKAEFARALRPWLADWEKGRAPDVHAAIDDSYEKRITLSLEVQRMLTPQQRAHVQEKLQGYIEDLNALAAKRVATN